MLIIKAEQSYSTLTKHGRISKRMQTTFISNAPVRIEDLSITALAQKKLRALKQLLHFKTFSLDFETIDSFSRAFRKYLQVIPAKNLNYDRYK